jgi:hypothetical protein
MITCPHRRFITLTNSTKCGGKIDQPQLLGSSRMDIGRWVRAPAAAPNFSRRRLRGRRCVCLGVLCATRGTSRVPGRCNHEAVAARQQKCFASWHSSSTLDRKHGRPIICLHQHGIQALVDHRLKMAKPPAMPSQPNTSFSMEFEPVWPSKNHLFSVVLCRLMVLASFKPNYAQS